MAEQELNIASSLHARFDWPSSPPTSPDRVSRQVASCVTTGRLTVTVGSGFPWLTDFEWNWIELLEWLAHSWKWLLGEDSLPVTKDFDTSVDLDRFIGLADSVKKEALWDFLDVHDLAAGLNGAWSSSLVVWRQGLVGHILTAESHIEEPWARTRTSLEQLGEAISSRLSGAPEMDDRGSRALESWTGRAQLQGDELMSIAGLVGSSAARVARRTLFRNSTLDDLPRSELFAAAKMVSGLSTAVIDGVLTSLESIPLMDGGAVNEIAERLLGGAVVTSSSTSYEQGYQYASAFRALINVAPEDSFDPKAWLSSVGVHQGQVDLQTPQIDAVAAWGASHGPGVLINPTGRHSQGSRGVNASLAHEICHLLVDRGSALPAAEVFGGRIDEKVEQRANAFAAELLLPRAIAGRAFVNVGDEAEAHDRVQGLLARYGGSREIIAWQVKNSGVPISDDARGYLRTLVTRAWEY